MGSASMRASYVGDHSCGDRKFISGSPDQPGFRPRLAKLNRDRAANPA
jgi:hypothetical protein